MSVLADIMDGLAGLASPLAPNVYPFPPLTVTIPAVVIGYPTSIEYDMAMQRGGDAFVLPVWFLVGETGRIESRDALFAILTDAASVKELFDGSHAFGDVRVTDAQIEEVAIAAVTYLAARFTTEVFS